MIFTNPTYLWSSLAISIPILIHLWSKRKIVRIKVGSIKFFKASEPSQTSTIQINEYWLLFLRILTIILLACILSEPHFKKKNKVDLLYVVEPSLLNESNYTSFFDEIKNQPIRVMVKGLPKKNDYQVTEKSAKIAPNYWQMTEELNALAADSVVVLTKGYSSGIKGKRPVSSKHINWIILNSDEKTEKVVEVTEKGDSLNLFTLFSDPTSLQFETKKSNKNNLSINYNSSNDSIVINESILPISKQQSLKILLVYHDSLVKEQKYIAAAYQSIETFLDRPIDIDVTRNIDSVNMNTYTLSIWLGFQPLKNIKGRKLIFKPDELAAELIISGASPNEFFLTQKLTSENSISEYLPEKLLKLLNLKEHLKDKIKLFDKRITTSEELQPRINENIKTSYNASFFDITPWFWAIFLLILIAERILSKYRKQ